MQGIYLHIPFCKQACHYCDFHFSTLLRDKAAMVDAMCHEIAVRHDYLRNRELNSIYFGGGTPSLLNREDLVKLFNQLEKYFTFAPDAEVTLEANPDDITRPALYLWREFGFNRLSIGLQSFNNQELQWMNRTHSASQSVNAVKLAQDAGFSNITIDLIYGSRFQSLLSWEQTLKQAIALNTQHISSYNLTIEDKTVLGVLAKKGKELPVNDDFCSDQFLMMKTLLEEAGFEHYEVSNFARPGYFARHNSNYWLQAHYLGIGPSAHSFNGTSRQWNIKNNTQYIKKLTNDESFFEVEQLSLEERYNEYILTRLRTTWGCNATEIANSFGEKIAAHFHEAVKRKKIYLQVHNGNYTLNPNGLLQADGIASDLFLL